MAPTIVQNIAGNGSKPNNTEVNSVSATFSNQTTAGNTILAFRTLSDFAGVHSDLKCNDAQTNLYHYLGQGNTAKTGGAQTISPWLALNIVGDSTALGSVGTIGTITGGSAYTAGTYVNVALTGGSGSGATADIVVASGAVSSVTIVSRGTGYTAGNTLSADATSIGGTGSGFSFPISTLYAGETVTSAFTKNDVEDFESMYIIEIGNTLPVPLFASSINVQNALAAGTNNITSGSITVTAAMCPCIMIACSMNTSGNGTPVVPTVGTGMTLLANCWDFYTGTNTATIAFQQITSAGSYSGIFNQGSSSSEDIVTAAVVVQGNPGVTALLNLRLPV